jgi:hypothetical protein
LCLACAAGRSSLAQRSTTAVEQCPFGRRKTVAAYLGGASLAAAPRLVSELLRRVRAGSAPWEVRAPRTGPPLTFMSDVGALAAAPARARAPARLGDVRDGRGRAADGPTQHESHLQRRSGRFPREGLLAWRAHRGSPGFVGCARQAKHQGREPPRQGMTRLAGAVGTGDTGAGVGHGPMLPAHLGHRLNCALAAGAPDACPSSAWLLARPHGVFLAASCPGLPTHGRVAGGREET